MRIVSIILSICLFFTAPVGVWGNPSAWANLEAQVERQVKQQTAKQAAQKSTTPKPVPALTARQAQIAAALDKVRLRAEDPHIDSHVITKEEFVILNRILTNDLTQKAEQDMDITKQIVNLLPQLPVSDHKGQPDYGQETKGLPFIYLTDASSHDSQSIVQEVQHVMRSVRQANPQARILLALEFAEMTNFATPIRFAGKQNTYMELTAPYDVLAPLADQLHMDTLALDDCIYWAQDEQVFIYKTGDKLLVEKVLPEILADEQQFKSYFKDLYVLNQSTYGMYLRNEQWIRYIQAVKPFYDIVIVYAGDGHIASQRYPSLNLPNQLKQYYATFNFYAAEINETAYQFTLQSHQQLCNKNACVPVPSISLSPEEEQAWQEKINPSQIEWDGTTYVYSKISDKEADNYLKTLPQDTQDKINGLFKQAEKLGVSVDGRGTSFYVYIPDVTQK